MSQPIPPESSESGFEEEAAVPVAKRSLRKRVVRLPERPRNRWLLGAAVVVVLGVVAVGGVAVAEHHDRGRTVFAWDGDVPGAPFPVKPGMGKGERGVVAGPDGKLVEGKVLPDGTVLGGAVVKPGMPGMPGLSVGGKQAGPAGKLAPAALPGIPADQAVAKAAGAVPGGKVDALSVVGREGGGSSWAVDVLGPDGVRHLVTVDGTDGSITGNTVNDVR
ncbi:PepSY domain-containing protein [Kitasatospora sp. NPDC049285]|uniref:PepSY domain-containing protein n=1 Tax=Kitasatospora sp. NPDC049285 TaxID=3157096 RepID=UPI00343241E3